MAKTNFPKPCPVNGDMRLIVIDLDRLKWLSLKDRKKLNAGKVCTLLKRDFGKKTLMKLPKNDPKCLESSRIYEDAIFKVKDDDDALKHENIHFRRVFKQIRWFRIGVILRREKAIRILGKLLGIS